MNCAEVVSGRARGDNEVLLALFNDSSHILSSDYNDCHISRYYPKYGSLWKDNSHKSDTCATKAEPNDH